MTSGTAQRFRILMADDNADDCLLFQEAIAASGSAPELRTFPDGESLLDHLAGLSREGASSTRPDLIVLDLNMPRKDGRETLRQLKGDPRWQRTPVVVLTTSIAPADVHLAYENGASSYIRKPATFRGWIDLAAALVGYWFALVELPPWE